VERRKFYATTMREALEQIQREFGDDAVVLDVKTLTQPGSAGEAPVTQVEVWAQAPPAGAKPAVAAAESSAPASMDTTAERLLQTLQTQVQTVHSQLETLPSEMPWLGTESPLPDDTVQSQVGALARRLSYSGGIRPVDRPHLVAVVGPNGAGKTTMLARWAWHFAVESGQSVGVLGADVTRIGAPEQLQAICRPMHVPCSLIYRPEQLGAALQQMASCALILLDTPGGNPRDAAYLSALHGLLAAADPAEVHLAIGADTSPAIIREIVERYRILQPDQVLLTRLDMANALPEVLPVLLETGIPLSYLGSGSEVPMDLCVASAMTVQRFA